MGSRTTSRKLEAYSFHGHIEQKPVDYAAVFTLLSSLPSENRKLEDDERLIALPRIRVTGTRIWLVLYEGPIGLNPLIFDSQRAKERVEHLRAGEVVAYKTHVLIDLSTHQAIVEYNHRGAKPSDLSSLIEYLAPQDNRFASIQFEIVPIADESFAKALDRFTRIRLARLRVTRPNIDWTDSYNVLGEVASDSSGRSIEVVVTADRGGSLSKNRGIIAFIKQLTSRTLAIVKGAQVIGTRDNEKEETTLSLSRYVEHQKVTVRLTKDGHVEELDIMEKMEKYMSTRKQRALKS